MSTTNAACAARFAAQLRAFGQALGSFVYVWDAFEDREADQRRGRFNALAACFGEAADLATVRVFLDDRLDQAQRSLETLPLGEQGVILAALLRSLHEIPGLRRLAFITSHPNFMTRDLVDAMAELPRVSRYLHLPAQSGSNAMLKAMRRGD